MTMLGRGGDGGPCRSTRDGSSEEGGGAKENQDTRHLGTIIRGSRP